MTTLQRKFLQTAPAVHSVKAGADSIVECFETTTSVGNQEQRVTLAVLVASLQSGPANRDMVSSILSRIRRECREGTGVAVSERLQNAVKRANTHVREKFPKNGGAAVIIVAITERDSDPTNPELVLQLMHSGNCRAYFVPGESLQTNSEKGPMVVTLNRVDTWGSRNINIVGTWLKETDKDKYPRWDEPLQYLGAGEAITPAAEISLPSQRTLVDANGFILRENDLIVLVPSELAEAELKKLLKIHSRQPPQKLAELLAQLLPRPRATDAAVAVIRQHTEVDWRTITRRGLLAAFRGLPRLVLLVVIGVLLYLLWVSRGVVQPLISYLPDRIETPIIALLRLTVQPTVVPTWTPAPTPSDPPPSPVTATVPPAANPIPQVISTPIEVPTPISTRQAVVLTPLTTPPVPVPTATFTPEPILSPTATVTATEVITFPVTSLVPPLQLPADANYSVLQGNEQKFQWLWAGKLEPNQAFQILTKKNEETDFSGLAGATNITDSRVTFKDGLYSFGVTVEKEPGNYQWTVALVEADKIIQQAKPNPLDVTVENAPAPSSTPKLCGGDLNPC